MWNVFFVDLLLPRTKEKKKETIAIVSHFLTLSWLTSYPVFYHLSNPSLFCRTNKSYLNSLI